MALFDTPLSGTAFLAAAFAVLTGGITLAGGAIVVAAGGFVNLVVTLLLAVQFAAGALLIAAGLLLRRRPLFAGAALDLVVCAVYLAYSVTEEPGLVVVPLGYVAVLAVCLGLYGAAARHDFR